MTAKVIPKGTNIRCIGADNTTHLQEGDMYTLKQPYKEGSAQVIIESHTGAGNYYAYRFDVGSYFVDKDTLDLTASKTQVGGAHYTDMGVQPLEAVYLNFGYMGLKAACYTKVLKYMGRVKDDEVEQLKKARHVLDVLIEKAEQQ